MHFRTPRNSGTISDQQKSTCHHEFRELSRVNNEAIYTIMIVILAGLVGLAVLMWVLGLIWRIIRSPAAIAIVIGLLALTISLMVLQTTR